MRKLNGTEKNVTYGWNCLKMSLKKQQKLYKWKKKKPLKRIWITLYTLWELTCMPNQCDL
jgi:hypothetical protein